jgi:hypothetical protein
MHRLGEAFDRVFKGKNRRHRGSLFPSSESLPLALPAGLHASKRLPKPDLAPPPPVPPLPAHMQPLHDYDWMDIHFDPTNPVDRRISMLPIPEPQDIPAPLKRIHSPQEGARLLARINQLDLTEEASMAALQIALVFVLQNEGSTFVNDPLDRGGPTRYGITQNTLSHFIGRTASVDEVRNISMATVTDIYRQLYWNPIKGDNIQDQRLATAIFDIAVLAGPSAAVRMAQAAVGAVVDGMMGPKTLAAINTCDADKALQSISLKACSYYTMIVLRDASQTKFLAGWQMRAHRLVAQNTLTV